MTRSGSALLTGGTSGRIVGAHLPGYPADDMINVFALAGRTGPALAALQRKGMGLTRPEGMISTGSGEVISSPVR